MEPNTTPVMPQGSPMGTTPLGGNEEPSFGKNTGAIIGIIIIVIILVVGGLYIWGKRLVGSPGNAPASSEAVTDTATNKLMKQSSSTAVSDIEADLSATTLNELDAELNSIDAELGQ